MNMNMTTMLAALLFAGCGPSAASDANGSCDTRSLNQACEDYAGPADVVATYKTACTKGTWKDGPCDRTGSVGGCQDPTGASLKLTITNWFFAPSTTAMVMAGCTSPATFVTP
jgi:hypothetical protein